jgi:toxin YhaV
MATLNTLVFEVIPHDPAHPRWIQGNTLGPANRMWRRAKFGERYRLFFRFDSRAKILIYGWINDEKSLRERGNRKDAYAVFAKMLASGSPPSRSDELLGESTSLNG